MMNIDILTFFPLIILICALILTLSGHLLHGSYLWEYSKPVFFLVWRVYMRIEWAVMRVMFKIGSGWLFRHSKALRHIFARFLQLIGNGEVYTLSECFKILDTLYKDYPHVFVALRICCCRQSMDAEQLPQLKLY